MRTYIAVLVGAVLVLFLSLSISVEPLNAKTQETECEEVTKSDYINNCDWCDPGDDPTCDEHWNVRVICNGKVVRMKVISRSCTAGANDPWHDSGWAQFTEGNGPPASSAGGGFIDANGNLVVPVEAGSGGTFTPSGGGGTVNFVPNGTSTVVFSSALLTFDPNLN